MEPLITSSVCVWLFVRKPVLSSKRSSSAWSEGLAVERLRGFSFSPSKLSRVPFGFSRSSPTPCPVLLSSALGVREDDEFVFKFLIRK